jgi:hypothetical protein
MEPGLTICIAAFQYPARPLLDSLLPCLSRYPGPFHILVGDDASGPPWKGEYDFLPLDYPHLHLVRPSSNLGRVGIRNRLAHEATTEWILFLDVDSEVPNANFLENYAKASEGVDLVAGGTLYTPDQLGAGSLRHRYGLAKEMVPASEREQSPFSRLTLNNLLCRREAFFAAGGLDRAITTYGHEDTLLGKKLQRTGAKIRHIDNPVIHTGLESDEVFLEKSEEAARGLARIYKAGKLTRQDAKLIEASELIQSFRLGWAVRLLAFVWPAQTLVGLDIRKLNAFSEQLKELHAL